MPKATDDTPVKIAPYIFYGVDLDIGRDEAVGECPFCDSQKFYVSVETGLWQCKVCGTGSERGGGNLTTFLRELWKISFAATNGQSNTLADNRRLAHPETLTIWETVESTLDKHWLIPGYSPDGKLVQLYRYTEVKDLKTGKSSMILMIPKGTDHALHGANLFQSDRPDIYFCEGYWDAMALWEVMRHSKRNSEGNLEFTANEASCLLSEGNVLAAPGSNVFKDNWLPLFSGKRIHLMYDSDHPRKNPAGGKTEPAGFAGAKRVAERLASAEQPPESIHLIQWGPEGWDPERKSGYDVRDFLTGGADGAPPLQDRMERLQELLRLVEPIPSSWVRGRTSSASKTGGVEIEIKECTEWRKLKDSWRKAMKWTPGLEKALISMLATIVSTEASGSQLWFKIIGPASCGKSTLCEAISVNRQYIFANSTMTGVHSGWKTDAAGDEDHSLIPKIKGKTLVIKDGDTLLRAGNRDKILAELRDLYDRTSRVHYSHGVSRDYENIDLTILLCGTDTLRALDRSELGARFLDCVIMEGIDSDLEDDVIKRVVNRTFANLAGGREAAIGHDDLAMVEAKQMTGGYINYLRQNSHELVAQVATNTAEDKRNYLESLGKFVSFSRARPSKEHEEVAERELGARLGEQFSRYAICAAVSIGKTTVDDQVIGLTKQIAMDTARGVILKLLTAMYKSGEEGLEIRTLAGTIVQTEEKTRVFMRFLRQIDAAEPYTPEGVTGIRWKPRWRLTRRLERLYSEVSPYQVQE